MSSYWGYSRAEIVQSIAFGNLSDHLGQDVHLPSSNVDLVTSPMEKRLKLTLHLGKAESSPNSSRLAETRLLNMDWLLTD